jgi:hypothetical protein
MPQMDQRSTRAKGEQPKVHSQSSYDEVEQVGVVQADTDHDGTLLTHDTEVALPLDREDRGVDPNDLIRLYDRTPLDMRLD